MYSEFKGPYPKFDKVIEQAVSLVKELNLTHDVVNQPD
jgi:hypothetical protein